MIPVNIPLFAGNENQYLSECVRSGWISSEGPFVKRFEEEFSAFAQRKYGIAVSSGTAALDIALKSLDLGKNDEVILPTFTIISCVLAVIKTGAKPILVDSDPDTWNMDVNQIAGKVTSRTKAIMIVHIYGLPVDIEPILRLAEAKGIKVVEDAAQMIGQTYRGRPCGSFGDLSTFSFYPNKMVTTGEGGMVVTNDEKLAARCRSLRNLCFEENARFIHQEAGWNYRMTNLQAAVGVAQLEKIDQTVMKKRWVGHQYRNRLKNHPRLVLPIEMTDYATNIYWIFGLMIETDDLQEVKIIRDHLKKNKIGTRSFFWCMHEQPLFKKDRVFAECRFPVAEKMARFGFYLPSGVGLNQGDITTVCDRLLEVL